MVTWKIILNRHKLSNLTFFLYKKVKKKPKMKKGRVCVCTNNDNLCQHMRIIVFPFIFLYYIKKKILQNFLSVN